MENENQQVNQTPVISAPPSISLTPTKSKLPFVLGGVLLLLLIGGGTYYLETPKYNGINQNYKVVNTPATPHPTLANSPGTATANTEFRTYQGQSYSFQYPSDWTIVKSDTNSITIQKEQMMEAQGTSPAQEVKVAISVYSTDVQPNTTLAKWLETRYLRSGDTNLFELTKQGAKKATLGGSESLAIQVPGAGGYIDEGTVSVYKGKGYDVSITGSEIQGSTDAYQMVLSTLKFTN